MTYMLRYWTPIVLDIGAIYIHVLYLCMTCNNIIYNKITCNNIVPVSIIYHHQVAAYLYLYAIYIYLLRSGNLHMHGEQVYIYHTNN